MTSHLESLQQRLRQLEVAGRKASWQVVDDLGQPAWCVMALSDTASAAISETSAGV